MDFNGFKGAAKPIDDIDLPKLGAKIGVGEDELHAFIDVETRGSGFDPQGRPRILFERHIFYRYCPAAKRGKAPSDICNKEPGGYGKESEQYARLERARKIDERAALYACSWGLGQIMGFNHELAGYDTVEAMILDFMADEEAHLAAAVTFIIKTGLDDELRVHSWAGFAKGYNGKNYKINQYDTKLADAYAKWRRIKDTPYPVKEPEPPVLPPKDYEQLPDPVPPAEPIEVSTGLKKWVVGAVVVAVIIAGATKYLGVW